MSLEIEIEERMYVSQERSYHLKSGKRIRVSPGVNGIAQVRRFSSGILLETFVITDEQTYGEYFKDMKFSVKCIAETVLVKLGEDNRELVVGSGAGDMLAANNLSDVTSAPVARDNLGLGDLAVQDDVYFTATGGTQRTVSSKLAESVSIADFWDGSSADHTTTVQAALDYASTNKAILKVGKKIWTVTSPLTATLTGDGSMSIVGDGPDVSVIRLDTGGNGLTVNLPGNYWLFNAGGSSGVMFKDVTFTTTNPATGDGISLIGSCVAGRPGAKVLFDNVVFRGYSLQSQFWSRAVVLSDCGYTWFDHCRFIEGGTSNVTSTGVHISGTAQANSPTVINFSHCEFYYGHTHISVGDYVEGVYVTQPTMVGALYGIRYDTATSESGLHVIGGHINSKQGCIYVNNLFDFVVSNVLFYRSGASYTNYRGVEVNGAAGRFSVTGNVFKGGATADGETAVLCTATSAIPDFRGGIISGNDFHAFGSRAVWLGVNSHRIHVGQNGYQDCALRVLNQSADCSADPKIYTTSFTATLTGGSASETINITIPTGHFWTKPGAVIVTSQSLSGSTIIGQYDFNNASTTSTNAVVVLRMLDGSNIPAGSARLGVVALENTGSGSW